MENDANIIALCSAIIDIPEEQARHSHTFPQITSTFNFWHIRIYENYSNFVFRLITLQLVADVLTES
jgi:hypothetical protein